jgi:hypothetical protein
MTMIEKTSRPQPRSCFLRRAAVVLVGTIALAVPAGDALACGTTGPAPQLRAQTNVQAMPMPQAAVPQNAAPQDVELYRNLSQPQAAPQGQTQADRDRMAAELRNPWYRAQDNMTNMTAGPACVGSRGGCKP